MNSKSPVQLNFDISSEEISNLLTKLKIPWQSWNNGKSNSFENLVESINKEQVAFRRRNSTILHVNNCVILTYFNNGSLLELFEDRQVHNASGEVRIRKFNGVSETLKMEEELKAGAERGLAEELGFKDPSKYQLSDLCRIEHRRVRKSEKWPGLRAIFHRHIFKCFLTPEIFNPEGYVRQDGDWTNHFKWKPAEKLP